MTIYLSGPMTGIKDFNREAFKKEAKRLRADGNLVFNPAEHYGPDSWTWADWLVFDLEILIKGTLTESCTRRAFEAIVMLPGWKNSKGAKIEHSVATQMGIQIIELEQEDELL